MDNRTRCCGNNCAVESFKRFSVIDGSLDPSMCYLSPLELVHPSVDRLSWPTSWEDFTS